MSRPAVERPGTFVVLFILMLVFHVPLPMFESVPWLDILMSASFATLLWFTGLITLRKKVYRRIFAGVFSLSILTSVLHHLAFERTGIPELYLLFHGGLFFALLFLLAREALSREVVDADAISAALGGLYVMGFAWGLIYAAMDHIIPGAFTVSFQGDSGLSSAVYFSFVTLTTLGFGDITPVAQQVRSMVVIEAILGQVYLIVLVARLVGRYGHLRQEN